MKAPAIVQEQMLCNFGWPQIPASEKTNWRFFDLNITMPSLFAALDSAQYSTARNTLMYKSLLFCQTYLECCLTAMIYRCKNVRVKQQRCYWAIMGVFWFWRRLTGSSLRAGLSRRKCRTFPGLWPHLSNLRTFPGPGAQYSISRTFPVFPVVWEPCR